MQVINQSCGDWLKIHPTLNLRALVKFVLKLQIATSQNLGGSNYSKLYSFLLPAEVWR